jgi:Acetyltransferase (GNAT) family
MAFQQGIDEKTMFPYVGNVVVDQSYRRKGIALSLMNQALSSTKAWGGAFAFCAVHTENEAASDLYLKKLGFRIFRLEKGDDNFFNPDKRSRYILVKEFPAENETAAEEEEDVPADAAECDDEGANVSNEVEEITLLKMQQKFKLENADKNEVDVEAVALQDAHMWGDGLRRIERIDYSDLLTSPENTSQTQAEFDLQVEIADGLS